MAQEHWFLFHCVAEPPVEPVESAVKRLFSGVDVSLQSLKSSQNFTYKVTTPTKQYIARLTPEVHQTPALIQAEMDFLKYLQARNVSVAAPIFDSVTELEIDGLKYFLVVFSFAEGQDPMAANPGFKWLCDQTPRMAGFVQSWGKWLAQLHNVSSSLEQAPARPQWDEVHSAILRRGREFLTEPEDERLFKEFDEVDKWARSLPTDQSVYGLLHGDLNISNFYLQCVNDQEMKDLQVFDWDQLQYGWYVYDISVVLWMIVSLNGSFPDCADLSYDWFSEQLLSGYQAERKLSEDELSWLPKFVQLRKLFYVLFCTKTLRDMKSEAGAKLQIPTFFPGLAKGVIDYYNSH